MTFSKLFYDLIGPNATLVKILQYVMRMQKIGFKQIFDKIDSNNSGFWSLNEFTMLNQMLKLELS